MPWQDRNSNGHLTGTHAPPALPSVPLTDAYHAGRSTLSPAAARQVFFNSHEQCGTPVTPKTDVQIGVDIIAPDSLPKNTIKLTPGTGKLRHCSRSRILSHNP